MIITITLIITFLVIINFLLLFFSSNKTERQVTYTKPFIIKYENVTEIRYSSTNLASTAY